MIRRLRRPLVRALRPLLLRLIDWQIAASESEIRRVRELRVVTHQLETTEHIAQISLQERRQQIERA
jgi:hypothetical protein